MYLRRASGAPGSFPETRENVALKIAVVFFPEELAHAADDPYAVSAGRAAEERFIGEDAAYRFPELGTELVFVEFMSHLNKDFRRRAVEQIGELLDSFFHTVFRTEEEARAAFGMLFYQTVQHAAARPAAFVVKHHEKSESFTFVKHDMCEFEVTFPEIGAFHALKKIAFAEGVRHGVQVDAGEARVRD